MKKNKKVLITVALIEIILVILMRIFFTKLNLEYISILIVIGMIILNTVVFNDNKRFTKSTVLLLLLYLFDLIMTIIQR